MGTLWLDNPTSRVVTQRVVVLGKKGSTCSRVPEWKKIEIVVSREAGSRGYTPALGTRLSQIRECHEYALIFTTLKVQQRGTARNIAR